MKLSETREDVSQAASHPTVTSRGMHTPSFVSVCFVQEMQKAFNSYKCLMISVNLSSRHFVRGDSAELRELQEALSSANQSWMQACGGLESWEQRLHSALMQCQVRCTNSSFTH